MKAKKNIFLCFKNVPTQRAVNWTRHFWWKTLPLFPRSFPQLFPSFLPFSLKQRTLRTSLQALQRWSCVPKRRTSSDKTGFLLIQCTNLSLRLCTCLYWNCVPDNRCGSTSWIPFQSDARIVSWKTPPELHSNPLTSVVENGSWKSSSKKRDKLWNFRVANIIQLWHRSCRI